MTYQEALKKQQEARKQKPYDDMRVCMVEQYDDCLVLTSKNGTKGKFYRRDVKLPAIVRKGNAP